MTTHGRGQNLGPAAAAANRAALIVAAREVFAEDGLHAPLSAIARRAGVGQGSLYRHFPDRVALAVAAFEDNVSALEALAGLPATTLADLLALVTRHIVEATAFVDLVRVEHADDRVAALAVRAERALAGRLDAGRGAGTVPQGMTSADLMLAVSMVAGAMSGRPAEERAQIAARAWSLMGVHPTRG
ncbi:MAG TPA: helix-turn-helix domain-containing protein [Arachnia sp.]|nr:helix-turn-helix domain-containing protein [Arachnia sp.]